jgi:hypothetical protein
MFVLTLTSGFSPPAAVRPLALVAESTNASAASLTLAAILSATFVTAVFTAIVGVWSTAAKNIAAQRSAMSDKFAEAFQVYADYIEYAYAIRRRDASEPAKERARISGDLQKLQSRISYFQTWVPAQAPPVRDAYRTLLFQMRHIAGPYMRSAWDEPGAHHDRDMNISHDVVDLTKLHQYEQAYWQAVNDYLDTFTVWHRLLHPRDRRPNVASAP